MRARLATVDELRRVTEELGEARLALLHRSYETGKLPLPDDARETLLFRAMELVTLFEIFDRTSMLDPYRRRSVRELRWRRHRSRATERCGHSARGRRPASP